MFGKADWGQHRDAGRYVRHIVTMTRCAPAGGAARPAARVGLVVGFGHLAASEARPRPQLAHRGCAAGAHAVLRGADGGGGRLLHLARGELA